MTIFACPDAQDSRFSEHGTRSPQIREFWVCSRNTLAFSTLRDSTAQCATNTTRNKPQMHRKRPQMQRQRHTSTPPLHADSGTLAQAKGHRGDARGAHRGRQRGTLAATGPHSSLQTAPTWRGGKPKTRFQFVTHFYLLSYICIYPCAQLRISVQPMQDNGFRTFGTNETFS